MADQRLTPEVDARIRDLLWEWTVSDWSMATLRLYLAETIALIDRQIEEKDRPRSRNQPPKLS